MPSPDANPPRASSNKSLEKALRILIRLGEHSPDMALTEIASSLRLNKATVLRLLRTLQKFRLVELQPHNKRYRLGLKFHELGARSLFKRSLQLEARPFLLELARRSKETVILAVPGAGGVICLDRADAPGSILTVRTLIGELLPAHCHAAGKAILAFLPERQAYNVVFRNGAKLYTPYTLGSTRQLKIVLDQVRRYGYATDQQEFEMGLSGVAAPVLFHGGPVIAALGMAGPTLRFVGASLDRRIILVTDFAARLSKTLSRGPADFGTVMDPSAGTSLGGRSKPSWRTPFALNT